MSKQINTPSTSGAALDGLHGAGSFARGWCARAWLIGGTHPLSSNIVCWPARG